MEPANDCSCSTCVGACHRRPGWFKPGEVETAASLVGMSIKDFFSKYIMVDYWLNYPNRPIFILSPATPGRAGRIAPLTPLGRCIFLVDDRCSIHEAKPYECAIYDHSFTSKEAAANHKDAAMAWKDHQAQIIELLGHDPMDDIDKNNYE